MTTESKTRTEAVLWDMDGTLIDSERLHWEVLAWQCGREGFEWSWEDNESILGATMDEKWRALNARQSFMISHDAWLAEFNAEYRRRLTPELGLASRVRTVLRLRELSLPMACVSNGEREVVEANLDALGLTECFQVVVAHGDCARGKPDPAPYLLGCRLLGKAPDVCAAVEDSPVGARSALAAGLTTIVWPEQGTWEGPQIDHLVLDDAFPWEALGL